jgi:hypothetical protein
MAIINGINQLLEVSPCLIFPHSAMVNLYDKGHDNRQYITNNGICCNPVFAEDKQTASAHKQET